MSIEEDITFNLIVNAEQAENAIRNLETPFIRAMGLMRRMGLPENMDAAITKVQRMIMTLRTLHTLLIATQTVSGPLGWINLALSAGTTALVVGDFAQELMSR